MLSWTCKEKRDRGWFLCLFFGYAGRTVSEAKERIIKRPVETGKRRFRRGYEASQSISVIAHEFMHGVSATNRIGYDPDLDGDEEKPLYYFWNGTKWIPESEDESDGSAYAAFEGGKTYELDNESLKAVK